MAENSNQTEIPAEILKVATKAINDRRAIIGAGMMTSDEFARLALEAANVGALLAEIAALKAELAKHQESQFHPDWPVLGATRERLREAWAKLKEMEQTAADALREAE